LRFSSEEIIYNTINSNEEDDNMGEGDREMEQRISKLETEAALSTQSRRNLHQQYEALQEKLDTLGRKLDAFLDNCSGHRTATALLRQEVTVMKEEVKEIREGIRWAIRTAIGALITSLGALLSLAYQLHTGVKI
jgi:uncharacterized coiled-coil DUF342 family protein